MKKIFVVISSFVLTFASVAVESVVVRTVYNSGKIESKTVSLEKQKDGAYRLSIPVVELSKDINFIDVHTDDAQAKKGDDGYWVLSDGRSGRFYRTYGHLVERRNPMPLYGVKKGDSAFVGIVKGLKYEFEMHIDVEEGNYTIYPRFLIKGIEFAPYEDLIVDYYNFKGKDANYSSMGKAYRKYQLDRGEVQPIRERAKKYPTLAYTADTMFVRVKHGFKAMSKIEHQTEENEPELNVSYTFDDFMKITRDLKSAGIDKLEMCFVGWHRGGFDGRFPDLFPVEPKFGGEAKMREAVKVGKELGYHMTTHINNHNMYKRAKGWSDEFVSKNRKGEPRTYVYWPGGQAYHTCFQTICDRYMDKDIAKLKDMGMNAPQHVDVTSAIRPRPCCDALHPNNRKQQAQHQIRLGEKYRKIFGGFTSEAGFDHCAKVLDYALYTSTASKGKAFVEATEKRLKRKMYNPPMVEFEILPLWQIVYHGIILSNVDWYTIDCYLKPKGHKWRLKFIECGGRPTFYWTKYKKQSDIDGIAEAYREYVPMRYLQYEFMDRHEEISKNVFLTGYSDGSEVVVNYTKKPFEYKGQTVSPRDYKLFKPSK
jgi:hypothetical protein